MTLKDYVNKNGLQQFLNNLLNTFALAKHTHAESEIVDLQDVVATDDDNGHVTLLRSSVAAGESDISALATRLSTLEAEVNDADTALENRIKALEDIINNNTILVASDS